MFLPLRHLYNTGFGSYVLHQVSCRSINSLRLVGIQIISSSFFHQRFLLHGLSVHYFKPLKNDRYAEACISWHFIRCRCSDKRLLTFIECDLVQTHGRDWSFSGLSAHRRKANRKLNRFSLASISTLWRISD